MAKRRKLTTEQKCAAQHFGPWMVEGRWFAQAVAAVKDGTFEPFRHEPENVAEDPGIVRGQGGSVLYYIEGDVARVPMFGQMTKGESSFGGVSSVRARQAIRQAVDDDRVNSIVLHIDSPGGTVAGTADLASEVAAADKVKPVFSYIEDLGASAAYWVASQSRAIFSNATAEIGSIGTMTYLYDTSGAYEKEGIKAILVSTGKYKGAWVDGLPVSDDYVKTIQTEINDLNEHFMAGVMAGRDMAKPQLESIADGRVFIASKAKQLGLIDGVASLDEVIQMASEMMKKPGEMWDSVMNRMRQTTGQGEKLSSEDDGTGAANTLENDMNLEQFNAFAAEHPEAVAAYIEQGHKAGATDARKAEMERAKALREACKNDSLAMDLLLAGKEAADATLLIDAVAKAKADTDAKLAAKDAEIAKLQAQVGTQGPVLTVGAAVEANAEEVTDKYANLDTDARIEAEWNDNANDCKSQFKRIGAYRGFRLSQLQPSALPKKK